MNKRIRKKKQKQRAKRSRQRIEGLIKEKGIDNAYVQLQIFGHYVLFNEKI